MRTLDCADVRDVAPEFAFGVLDGAARAEVVHHLDHCPACRTLVSELAETADSVVLLAPEAEPPPGFERRVVGAIVGGERQRRWRTVKLVAAVAAAAVIVSVVTVRVIDRSRAPADSAAPVVATVAMIGGGGLRVGQVQMVDDGALASLVLTVDYALGDGGYRVVLDPEGGGRQVLGTIDVTGGRGSWSGSARLGDEPTDLALVDAAGAVQCAATLPVS
jgi:predicted anti-sigma-YlaC factor YlaD